SIERLPRCGLNLFDDGDDFVNRGLIDQTARAIDEQTNIFVKLDIRWQFHCSLPLPCWLNPSYSTPFVTDESKILRVGSHHAFPRLHCPISPRRPLPCVVAYPQDARVRVAEYKWHQPSALDWTKRKP